MNPKVILSLSSSAPLRFCSCKRCGDDSHRDSSLSLSLAAFVGRNVILTSGCIIGACCNVNTYEVIPENTVIYGADCLRRVQTERPQVRVRHGDTLSPPAPLGLPSGCCPQAVPSPPLPPFPAPDAAAGFPDEDPAQLPPPEEDHEGHVHPCQELSTHLLLPVPGRVFGPGKRYTLREVPHSIKRFLAYLCNLFLFTGNLGPALSLLSLTH